MKPVVTAVQVATKQPGVSPAYRLALLIAGALLLSFLGALGLQPARAQTARAADQAAIAVTQTIGENAGICASATVIAVTAGKNVYYCVKITNQGTVPLTRYTLVSSSFPSNSNTATFTQTLNPGQEIQVTKNVLDSLGASGTILSQLTSGTNGTVLASTITVTATNSAGATATGQATARFVIGSVGLQVTKNVDTNDSCTNKVTGLAVTKNTTVKYCVTIKNTGTLTLTNHHLADPLLKVDVTVPLTFPPGATLVITDGALQKYDSSQRLILALTTDITNITNTVRVTSTTAQGLVSSGSAQAIAAVGKMSSVLTYTVGLQDNCATSIAMPFASGSKLYYCLKLTNNGTMPLEGHTIRWVQNSVSIPLNNNIPITQTVQPGQTLIITHSRLSQLEQANVTSNSTNNFTVTSTNHRGMVATANAQSTITVGPQTLTVTKYAPTTSNGCVSGLPLNIIAGQEFYYCVILTNTGQVPLVRHAFVEDSLIKISGVFTYTLLPNQKITLTNQFLSTVGLPSNIFGPFKATTSYAGVFNVSSTAANNVTVYQSNTVQVNVSAATPTATPPPTAIPTFTPSLTPIPSSTPTLPPTLTPTPVVLSFQPTPTQPFSVNSITTPTPGVVPGSAPAVDQFGQPITPAVDQFGQPITPAVDQFGQPISPLPGQPTVDIASTVFALTVEAAATQTALFFVPPPVVETPIAPPVVASPLETPTPAVTVVVTPTATPVVLIMTPLPSPEVTDSYLAVVSQVFQVSTATLGWLWFGVGSLIFFVTAGMFAGLGWRYRGRERVYDMNTRTASADEGMRLEPSTTQSFSIQSPAPPSAQSPTPDDEEYWPPSLR